MKKIEQCICEEFSNKVSLTYSDKPYHEGQSICAPEIEEIKCIIKPNFFDEIIDRMEQVGYYCCHFQKDPKQKKTILWFKPEVL